MTLANLLSGLIGAVLGLAGSCAVAVLSIREQRKLWQLDRRREEWRQLLAAVGAMLTCATAWERAEANRDQAATANRSDLLYAQNAAAQALNATALAAETAMRIAVDRVHIPDARTHPVGKAAAEVWGALVSPPAGRAHFDTVKMCGALRAQALAAARSDLG